MKGALVPFFQLASIFPFALGLDEKIFSTGIEALRK